MNMATQNFKCYYVHYSISYVLIFVMPYFKYQEPADFSVQLNPILHVMMQVTCG